MKVSFLTVVTVVAIGVFGYFFAYLGVGTEGSIIVATFAAVAVAAIWGAFERSWTRVADAFTAFFYAVFIGGAIALMMAYDQKEGLSVALRPYMLLVVAVSAIAFVINLGRALGIRSHE